MLGGTGRLLIVLGGALAFTGVVLVLLERVVGDGRIPGNIVIQRDNFTVFMPVGAMILVSVLMTLVLNVLLRLRR